MQIPGTGELVIGTTPDVPGMQIPGTSGLAPGATSDVPALNDFWGTHVGDSRDGRTGAP